MPERLERRQSLQTIAWFNDLNKRQLLNLTPPYQRRSVWNQQYREYFVETILLGYPAPAIFLHEDIRSDGTAHYNVVDGKQRLTAIFEFISGSYAIAEDSALERYQGQYFSALDDSIKKSFWTYQFLVEYLPTTDEATLNNVFDRINRNVAKLTKQELRHAKFDGRFARATEDMTELVESELPTNVPHIAAASKRQMKDVELVAQLLLLIENGPQAFSQEELDEAYSSRDEGWEAETSARARFTEMIAYLKSIFSHDQFTGFPAPVRRIRNQADFYSLFGAAFALQQSKQLPDATLASERLASFLETVSDEIKRAGSTNAVMYYDAARSASNDAKQRNTRIRIISEVLSGVTEA
ncbi:DUF262 domain-containing protein [Streptomyces sp. NBC_01089]|uniref:DUF262 domain-containing protein n=1 Tax=Streptomyces sp. NBC_01089 TaxID=2903747 RepID=UPI00386C2B17|nr:DUF262 domain-containing protein [Streptomyces sp. NBC_01089]